MESNELPARMLEAITQHVPTGTTWLPIALAAVLALGGLLVMFRGARLAPVVVAIVLTLVGGLSGALTSHYWAVLPFWVTAAVGGMLGLTLGLVLFRFWMALQVAGLLIVGALALYSTRLMEPLSTYVSKEFDPQTQEVSLLDPAQANIEPTACYVRLGELWTYLGTQVPTFHASFIAIVLSAGAAGLAFGVLMPKAARSFWAATLGTGLFVLAGGSILYAHWPETLERLGSWGLLIIGGLWAVSLAWNLIDTVGTRPKKTAATDAKQAAA